MCPTSKSIFHSAITAQCLKVTKKSLAGKHSLCQFSTQCLKLPQKVVIEFWHFPTIFGLLKLACLATLFDSIGHLLGIFNEVLFTRRSLAALDETFSVIFKHREP